MAGAAPGTVLLHGVTGSGKTEVYLRAAARALAAGRQALVLVPEINLTPQLVARFARALRRPAHRRPAQRPDAGAAPAPLAGGPRSGAADIVLGTRLAVFAPLPRLGLIVVDEEHDPSYKQQEGARYSARDLAVWRGRREDVLVVLGSATPSLESWHSADAGRYRRLALPARIGGAAWPAVRLVDMGRLPKSRGAPAALAPPLVAALDERGSRAASRAWCSSTGAATRRCCTAATAAGRAAARTAAPGASSTSRTGRCAATTAASPSAVPRACPDCGNPDIAPIGRGTERLEEQLGGAAARGADRAHRRRQHAQARARSRRSSAPCTPARSTSWSARR